MKYVIPIGGYALKSEFAVKNEYGETVLKVEMSKYSLRNRISIRDQYAIEIGHIKKRLLTPGLTYEIHHEEELKAILTKGRWFFNKRYKIKTVDGDKYRARGNFKDLDYEMMINGRYAAKIDKKLALRQENYAIDVHNRASPYLCICAALTIEAIEKSA